MYKTDRASAIEKPVPRKMDSPQGNPPFFMPIGGLLCEPALRYSEV